ncbi:helix-turn-helix domain-containing protein [Saccharopolyspora elongata]|uniref:XRE family transcriptional regulator n=1 Tax=Saccharopolyspora elongata TaxID=2530387 RepID=A0A4R4Y715_9PSEU|nr:XRE family transcriptional regulator [Saccharopolyspora elongata]TDD38792.1 XRE family transcriptional regulator [Saccharopolyspora elongata]
MGESDSRVVDANAVAEVIGGRVRRWRSERNWTLDGLAERSGVGRRTLVLIEQGQSNPSIGLLLRLASAFGVGLSDLVEDVATTPVRVHRAGEAPTLWQGPNGGRGVLVGATEPPQVVELWDWVMAPGERHDSEPHSQGTREVLFVHEGQLEVHVGTNVEHLAAGDSVVLRSDQSHGYACAGSEGVHFSMTVLQPGVGGGN